MSNNKQRDKALAAKTVSRKLRKVFEEHGVRLRMTFLRPSAVAIGSKNRKGEFCPIIDKRQLIPVHILRKTRLGVCNKGGLSILEASGKIFKKDLGCVYVTQCSDEDQFNRNLGWYYCLRQAMMHIANIATDREIAEEVLESSRATGLMKALSELLEGKSGEKGLPV